MMEGRDIFTSASIKKQITKLNQENFYDASSLGLELDYDLDFLVDNHIKNRVMHIYTGNEHQYRIT